MLRKTLSSIIIILLGILFSSSAFAVNAETKVKAKTPVKKVTKAPVKKTIKKTIVKTPIKPVVTPLLIAGWVPYWSKNAGGTETVENLSKLNIVSPFSYEVDGEGDVVDKLKIDSEPWPTLFNQAKSKNIKIYPTVTWFNRAQMQSTLNSETSRSYHIGSITAQILDNPNFDGVDIDYENKSAETKDGFSAFLRELSVVTKSKNKKLICTIEPRTPADSRFRELTPEKLADSKIVSNDYTVIAKYCDQVRLLTYDQRDADIKLHDQFDKIDAPYMPVADPVWVEKVIKLALQDIPANKIQLGIPTFGYKWELTPDAEGKGYVYTKLRAVNFREAYNESKARGIDLTRNQAGELSYVYDAVGAQSFAGSTTTPKILVWFPDAESMVDKINLAKKYKIGGVVVFKFDGGADQTMWDVLKQK